MARRSENKQSDGESTREGLPDTRKKRDTGSVMREGGAWARLGRYSARTRSDKGEETVA